MPLFRVHDDRVTFREGLTSSDIKALIEDKALEVLQTDEPADDRTWGRINAEFIPARPDVSIRAYAQYQTGWDLSFVERLPNAKRLIIDCTYHSRNPESLFKLPELEQLRIGIYDLTHFDFLETQNPNRLTDLSLQQTKSKKPSIASIGRFKEMKTLSLEAQQKGIEAIADLKKLEILGLRSITVSNLDFLIGLEKLWWLALILGGTTNLEALRRLKNVKYLEVILVRGLADLGAIGSMSGLQNLSIQALRNVTTLPNMSAMTSLRRINLEDMKGLEDVTALATAPNLEELGFYSARQLSPEDFLPVLGLPTLRSIAVGFGSQKKNDKLQQMAEGRGIVGRQSHPFVYR